MTDVAEREREELYAESVRRYHECRRQPSAGEVAPPAWPMPTPHVFANVIANWIAAGLGGGDGFISLPLIEHYREHSLPELDRLTRTLAQLGL